MKKYILDKISLFGSSAAFVAELNKQIAELAADGKANDNVYMIIYYAKALKYMQEHPYMEEMALQPDFNIDNWR